MVKINLHPEQKNIDAISIVVRNKDYSNLKKMQYSGGFKRFGLSLMEDKVKIKSTSIDHEKMSTFLGCVFGKQSIEQ